MVLIIETSLHYVPACNDTGCMSTFLCFLFNLFVWEWFVAAVYAQHMKAAG